MRVCVIDYCSCSIQLGLTCSNQAGITNLDSANADIPLAITNLTTNGNANDINKVYAVVDKLRIVINTALTQSGVRGESPIEPDGTSKTS